MDMSSMLDVQALEITILLGFAFLSFWELLWIYGEFWAFHMELKQQKWSE